MPINNNIIDQFELLIKQINAEYLNAEVDGDKNEITKHRFRLQQTKKALSIIKKIDFEIKNAVEMEGIPGIGIGTLKRIQEILDTGILSELKTKYKIKSKQIKIDSIQELTKVIGIGDVYARKLVINHKILSIKDLKSAIKNGNIEVNDKIKLGLKYYGIVKGVIPRDEIQDTEKMFNVIANKIDTKLKIVICGSYRREKNTSNDIDMLIYHPDIKSMKEIFIKHNNGEKSYLELFVELLTSKGYIIDHLTDKNYTMKYMGFLKYNNYDVRRLDIRYISLLSLPTALLYFTGPYELNTYMRQEAKKRNMLLNEYGLYKVDKNDVKKLIKIKSEKNVFEKLGMKYLTPSEREQFNINTMNKF
jgi:DNA polymerase beta